MGSFTNFTRPRQDKTLILGGELWPKSSILVHDLGGNSSMVPRPPSSMPSMPVPYPPSMVRRKPFRRFSDHMFTDCSDSPPISRSFAASLAPFVLLILRSSCLAGACARIHTCNGFSIGFSIKINLN